MVALGDLGYPRFYTDPAFQGDGFSPTKGSRTQRTGDEHLCQVPRTAIHREDRVRLRRSYNGYIKVNTVYLTCSVTACLGPCNDDPHQTLKDCCGSLSLTEQDQGSCIIIRGVHLPFFCHVFVFRIKTWNYPQSPSRENMSTSKTNRHRPQTGANRS